MGVIAPAAGCFTFCMYVYVQVMLRETPEWKPAASKEQAMKVALGELVEAVDVPEEQEDTVFWRGCVHELKPDGQVRCRNDSCLIVVPPKVCVHQTYRRSCEIESMCRW